IWERSKESFRLFVWCPFIGKEMCCLIGWQATADVDRVCETAAAVAIRDAKTSVFLKLFNPGYASGRALGLCVGM
ncbi:MAG: hypothetical protein LBD01_02735, partial [Puniceicoccales bacterium]|nr:hypothetical protein [Puniceicoccales bacterium]